MSDYLIRMNTADKTTSEVLKRLPLRSGVHSGGISEEELQSLIFCHPKSLPISEIDPTYEGIVPVCTELKTQSGYIDALFVNSLGRIVLVEFKLWRNPEARREVIGQILDYAKDLASWNYEDLQTRLSLKFGRTENVLFKLVQRQNPELNEKEFVDNVSRNLKRGEFLLLIVGDGIQEGVENIVGFVQRHSGLHFSLALVEAAIYKDADDIVINPRVLARTEIVDRFVIEGQLGAVVPSDNDDIDDAVKTNTLTKQKQANQRFWDLVVDGFTFSDPSIDPKSAFWPSPCRDSTLYVQVRNTSFNGWALFFGAFINRSQRLMGCYFAVRKGQARETRIYESILDSIDELREEIGEDLKHWHNPADRPRIGFTKAGYLSFLAKDSEGEVYREAVAWMKTHLDRLVSHLHPRVQSMLSDDD